MTDRRPVLIGMNNPLSSDPRHALYPHPVGSSGWRLWRMLHERTGATRADYLRVFDRRNLVSGAAWSRQAAAAAAPALWRALRGRSAVVLGLETHRALGLPAVPHVHASVTDGVEWRYLPHPSGRSRWYNDDLNWATAGLLLEDLYVQAGGRIAPLPAPVAD